MIYGYFMPVPVPRARDDDVFTAVFDADTNRKERSANCLPIMFSFPLPKQRISREHFQSMSARDRARHRSVVSSPVSRCSSRRRSSGASPANRNRERKQGRTDGDL